MALGVLTLLLEPLVEGGEGGARIVIIIVLLAAMSALAVSTPPGLLVAA